MSLKDHINALLNGIKDLLELTVYSDIDRIAEALTAEIIAENFQGKDDIKI